MRVPAVDRQYIDSGSKTGGFGGSDSVGLGHRYPLLHEKPDPAPHQAWRGAASSRDHLHRGSTGAIQLEHDLGATIEECGIRGRGDEVGLSAQGVVKGAIAVVGVARSGTEAESTYPPAPLIAKPRPSQRIATQRS